MEENLESNMPWSLRCSWWTRSLFLPWVLSRKAPWFYPAKLLDFIAQSSWVALALLGAEQGCSSTGTPQGLSSAGPAAGNQLLWASAVLHEQLGLVWGEGCENPS